MQQSIILSQLPDNIKIEATKSDLIAFAHELMRQNGATTKTVTATPTKTVDETFTEIAADPSSDIMTREEAAAFLNIADSTLYRRTSDCTIPHMKQGKLYFKKTELEAWLTQGKRMTSEQLEALAENHIVNRSKNKKGGQHGK